MNQTNHVGWRRFLLALILAILAIPITYSYDFEVDGIFYDIGQTWDDEYGCVVTYESFQDNSYSGDIVIPDSVTYESETYPVLWIGAYAFYKCPNLNSVVMPKTITGIDWEAFRYSGISTITIPCDVTYIEQYAFYDCSNLSLFIDNSDALIDDTSGNYGNYHNILNSTSLQQIYCHTGRTSDYNMIYTDGYVLPTDRDDKINLQHFKLQTKTDMPDGFEINSIAVYDASHNQVYDNDGVYTVPNRKAHIAYNLNGYDVSYNLESSAKPDINITVAESTQTTLTLHASVTTDETCNISKIYIERGSETYDITNDGTVLINGFYPGWAGSLNAYIDTNAGLFTSSIECQTKPLNLQVSHDDYGPCRVKFTASWDDDGSDLNIISYGFTDSKDKIYGDKNLVYEDNGLTPASSLPLYYVVTLYPGYSKYNRQTYRVYVCDQLPALEWGDNTPVATSTTSVRLISATNCNALTDTGFEWKRYNAPDDLAPTQVSCPVVDGILVGSLRNLNPEVYYKYRPYYTSAAGTTYYGSWTTFFTGDANVYFEPDVRTYEDIQLVNQTATVKGYVLPGSEDITEQGFQYKVLRSGPYASPKSDDNDDWISISASGILMSATISDLNYATTYAYRTYAKTASGTFYGDTQQFTTEDTSGFEEIVAGNSNQETISLSLRENPISGTAWIKIDNSQSDRAEIYVVSVNGMVVANTTVQCDSTWQPVELPISSGLYIIMATDGQSRSSKRLIVR